MYRVSYFVVCLLPFVSGCIRPAGAVGTPSDQGATKITQEELRDKLDQSQESFEAIVQRACDELLARDDSRRIKRLTLLWQMRILPMSRDALDQDNPVGSLLDLATLCARQRQYFESGEGKEMFGAHQEIAVRAAEEASREIEKVATVVFSPEQLAEARARIRQFAEEYPLRGEFSGSAVRVVRERVEDSVLQGILAIPLTPFRWLGGVDHTAQAIKGFTVVAGRLTEVADRLAADARLQMQLLMLEAEDLEAVRSSLDSFARLAKSSERLAKAAESLLADARQELVVAFDEIESKQAELRTTIRDTRDMAERVDAAAQSLAAAADAIGTMVAGFRSEKSSAIDDADANAVVAEPSHPPQTPARPPGDTPPQPQDASKFDINEYTRLSESVDAAAKELRALATEVDTVVQSEALKKRLDDLDARLTRLLSETETKAAAATDHAAWRLAQLAVLGFVLAFLYRLLARRYFARRE